ncbi:MAG: endolytic transglycosylase MltG [Bacteroides sp.]|nr:endolytic transglycosylase MltG [Prevotella sp.]MCM1407895.1 endolytic transglycosylase MltG [Treponema brennaborense]MCM1469637.1 endolytic transglycosylase MltG [Bacteroides sp.]
MKHNIMYYIAGFILLFFVCCGTVCCYFLSAPKEQQQKSVYIERGMSVKQIAALMKKNGFIRAENLFCLYVRQTETVLKAGKYSIPAGLSLPRLVRHLATAKPDFLTITIPEGTTYREMALLFEKQHIISAERFTAACTDKALLSEYHIPHTSFEGYLFPDTYQFDYDVSAETIVRILADQFFRKIAGIPELAELPPKALHEKLIFASIVEREYRVAEEAPLIASVFYNRYKANIGLGSCATIEYIITDIQNRPHPKVITYEDLKINSPYNTYKWAALPPGPISNPGLIALNAAANPPKTRYYYFRLADADAGIHVFSETLQKHESQSFTLKKAAAQ